MALNKLISRVFTQEKKASKNQLTKRKKRKSEKRLEIWTHDHRGRRYTTPATFWKSPPTGDAWFRYHFRFLKNINVSF